MKKKEYKLIMNHVIKYLKLANLKCYETFFTLTKEEQQFVAELASQTIYNCEQIAKCYLDNKKDKNKTKTEVLKYNVKLFN